MIQYFTPHHVHSISSRATYVCMYVCRRPIISEPDDRAVVLIATTLILHPSVNNAADGLVDVVWTHVLEIPDYFQTSRLADTQANSHTDIQTHRHTDIQTYTDVLEIPDYFQTSRLADTQANSHTDIQTNRHTDIHTHTHRHTDVLEVPDYFQTSRLADTQANSRTDTQTNRQHFSGHFSREPSSANYSLDGPSGLLVKHPHKISNSVVKLPRIVLWP